MFSDKLFITKFIPRDVGEVFHYWTEASLLEQWCAPEGMTLKVPFFEAKEGGNYRYEHTSAGGVYVCTGYFKEYIPHKKLVTVDSAKNPLGQTIFTNLECSVVFTPMPGGTHIEITQSGFPDEKFKNECEVSWDQCLTKLNELLTLGYGYPQDRVQAVNNRSSSSL